MTDADLLAAIVADPTSKALADAGNDSGCAAAVAPLLPAILAPKLVTERGLFDAFPNPADAEAILQGLAAVATANPPNPVVARTLRWLSPDLGGLDMGNPNVRGMIDQLAAQVPTIFTAARVAILKAIPLVPQAVTAADVSRVYAVNRPNGKVK